MTPTRFSRLASVTSLSALVIAGCGGTDASTDALTPASRAVEGAPVVVVHRTPTCGCCGTYEEYLHEHGFEVRQEMHDDIGEVKDRFGVPAAEGSCHTNEIDGYFVEGHVPVEAIDRLLERRPAVDGITLAGMPPGSPGMPGDKQGPFVVNTVVDGEVTGELGRF